MCDYLLKWIEVVSDKLKDMTVGKLQLIKDPAWNERLQSDIMGQTREVQQWYEDHPGPETVDSELDRQRHQYFDSSSGNVWAW
jgi:hypothetical protein